MYLNFNINNGLNSNEVYELHEDRSGYIWMASDRGISRFNGEAYTHFTPNSSSGVNDVFNIYEHENKIWFTSYSKLYYIENDTVYDYAFNDTLAKYLQKKAILSQLTFHSDHISFCSNRHFLYSISNTGHFRLKKKELSSVEINVYESYTVYGNLGISGYRIIDKDTIVSQQYDFKNDNINMNLGFSKKDQLNGHYTSLHNVLIYYNTLNKKNFTQSFEFFIHDFIDLGNGTILMGTNKGLKLAENNGTQLIIKETYFENQTVTSVILDSGNRIWLATLDKGVILIPNLKNQNVFDEPPNTHNFKKLIPGDHNFLILNQSGVNYLIDSNHYFLIINKDGFNKNIIYNTALFDSLSQVFYAFGDFGYRAVINKNKISLDSLEKYSGSQKSVTYFDEKLAVSSNSGLFFFKTDAEKKKLSRIKILFQKLNIDQVFTFKNDLYFCNFSDVFLLKDSTSIKKIKLAKQAMDVDTLNDKIIFSTMGGGLVISESLRRLIHITEKDGLLSDYINACFIENDTSWWVASDKGISKIHYQNENNFYIENYDQNFNPAFKNIRDLYIQNSTFYLLSNRNLYLIDKTTFQTDSSFSPIYFVDFRADGKHYLPSKKIKLPPSPSLIEIKIDALNYTSSKNSFFVELIFNNTSRHFKVNTTTIELPLTAPGDYALNVYNFNKYGERNPEPVSISFSIQTPFYYTTIAWFLYIILLILLLYLFVKWRISIIKNKEEKRRKFEVRAAQLELKALQAQMNPHFIFNVLSSIQYYIHDKQNEKAEYYLLQFTALIRQVLEFSEKKFISLEEELNNLDNYLSLEKMRKSRSFDYTINISDQVDTRIILPPLIFQPIVENSIHHGLKGKRKGGMISISIQKNQNRIACTITDNGSGMIHKKSNEQTDHHSMGSKIYSERIKLWSKTFNIDIKLNSRTLYNNNKITGSEVYFILPNISEA